MNLSADIADIDTTIDHWREQPEAHERLLALAVQFHCTAGWRPIRRAMIEYIVDREISRFKRAT